MYYYNIIYYVLFDVIINKGKMQVDVQFAFLYLGYVSIVLKKEKYLENTQKH